MAKAHNKFPSVYECSSRGREQQVVVSDLDGTLLRSSQSFPYYMLLAWEAPAGLLRFTTLLLLSPALWLLYRFVSEAAALQVMVWVSLAGVKVSDIERTARAVLPKFYVQDVHPESWRVVSAFGRRYLLTANPRIMVEPFAKQYLGMEGVLGSELAVCASSGRATGFLRGFAALIGHQKAVALRTRFGDHQPDVGLGDRATDYPFLAACKEGYIVPPHSEKVSLSPGKLSQPLVFHDGRLASKPTPYLALLILLWIPLGLVVSFLRMLACLLPPSMSYHALRSLGVRLIVNGVPPSNAKNNEDKNGVLFVSTHRTSMDPFFISLAIKRQVTIVTYSSRFFEIISPISIVQLTTDKEKDVNIVKRLLQQGNLVMFPEGTTCREPFLLRFNALFAELADCLVPVALNYHVSMFHATTTRGCKGLGSFYFFLNPLPCYEVTFLKQLPLSLTCASGKTSSEVANYVQDILASTLNFKRTNLTRKDKYDALIGSDGATLSHKKEKKL